MSHRVLPFSSCIRSVQKAVIGLGERANGTDLSELEERLQSPPMRGEAPDGGQDREE
jgi:hypothetical protein